MFTPKKPKEIPADAIYIKSISFGLTSEKVIINVRNVLCTESPKSYNVIETMDERQQYHGCAKRIDKTKLNVVDTFSLNRLSLIGNSDFISYHVFCLPDRESDAKEILITHVQDAINNFFTRMESLKKVWDESYINR